MKSRNFWQKANQHQHRDKPTMNMSMSKDVMEQFRLTLGPLAITLTPAELSKLKTLTDRAFENYKSDLTDCSE